MLVLYCTVDMCAHVPVILRCVKGEGDMEKLQAKVLEMRRKLDDTTAAMQELGRENQSLQVSHSTSRPSSFQLMSQCRLRHDDGDGVYVMYKHGGGRVSNILWIVNGLFGSLCSDQAVPVSDQEVGGGP